MSGSSHWDCVCSLRDSVMTLLAFPYLRVGVLLAWGVYSIGCCEVCSLGRPSWLVLLFMSLFVLRLLLGWGGFGHRSVAPPAAPVCWAILGSRLRCSVTLASDRTLSLCFLAWVFFLGRLLGLGLVGCSPAWVPAFFWGNSPSLVLVFAGRFLPFGCPGFWCFPGIFTWVLSSRFQCLLMAWGGYG